MTTRRDFLKLGATASFSAAFLSRDIYAKYESDVETSGNDVVMRCCVMSDVHLEASPRELKRFRRAIQFANEYSESQPYDKLDAFVVVGDMTHHGTKEQLELFKNELDLGRKPGTDAILCMGNHEYIKGNRELWESVLGVKANARYERNGYQFITVSPEHGNSNDGPYLYAIEFLEKELEAAYKIDPTKPIFVVQHIPAQPTVYGSYEPDDWGAVDLFDTLQKYPTVVDLTGHTHCPANDPRCAWQGQFTAFGCGTLSEMCHGTEGDGRFGVWLLPESLEYGQFFMMEVRRDNSITLKLYDLATESFFDMVYYVGKAGDIDSYVYTNDRFVNSEKPTWREGTKIKARSNWREGTKIGASQKRTFVTLEFTQAYCKDVVRGYRADIKRFDENAGDWVDLETRYLESMYFERNMPETIRFNLDADDDVRYRVEITALSAFLLESDEKISIEYKISPQLTLLSQDALTLERSAFV